MIKRTYTGEADLQRLQEFNAAAIAITNHCGYLHPGDIPHHIFNGNKHYDPTEVLTIWENDQGIAAWLLINVNHKGFDAQVRPDLRGNALERELLAYAEERLIGLMRQYNIAGDHIYAETFRDDTVRCDLLRDLGWQQDDALPFVLNRAELDSIERPLLPEGYSFQSAKGIEDAAALAAVHNASFNPTNWTPALYQKVMESPGYAAERELVIRAPDGTYVAFCIIWYDHLNRIGLFEPVGTHRDYQRRGFGRALVRYGMQQMAAAGMEWATVAHFGDNEAARALYQGCGFRPWYLINDYIKYLPEGRPT